MKFFKFRQNNSGGHWYIDDEVGLGPNVWIEANSPKDANRRAEDLGIYFDGVATGNDCECCGDRWSPVWAEDTGKDAPVVDSKYDFYWYDTVYVHHADGKIDRLKK